MFVGRQPKTVLLHTAATQFICSKNFTYSRNTGVTEISRRVEKYLLRSEGKFSRLLLDSGQLISMEGQMRLFQSGLGMGKLMKRIFCFIINTSLELFARKHRPILTPKNRHVKFIVRASCSRPRDLWLGREFLGK